MRMRIITAAIVAALVAGAGAASAAVLVYSNSFSSRGDFKAIKKAGGGKACAKSWRGKKQLLVRVKGRQKQCDFRTPVVGDAKEPDHEIDATAQVPKSIPKRSRKSAFAGVALRADNSSRYELRVFPHTRSWELHRDPSRQGFPITGTDDGINRLGKKNRLRLRAFGNKIMARVNKARVVPEHTDPNPGQLGGRRTLLVGGNAGGAKKGSAVSFRNLRVRLP